MNSKQSRHEFHQVFILIAPGFDDLAVAFSLSKMRKHGLSVGLVGSMSELCRSQCGLFVHPDFSLGEMAGIAFPGQAPRLVIIPGGRESTALLFSDPRVLHVCNAVLQAQGYVAAFSSAQRLVVRSGIPIDQETPHFLAQNDAPLSVFVQQLAECVSVVPVLRHVIV